jgi:UrcA family protein
MYKHHIAAGWVAVGLLTSATFLTNFASAATVPSDLPTVRVQYGDLDLNSDQDVRKLYNRIRVAAGTVCKGTEGPQLENRLYWTSWHACIAKAVWNAVGSVSNQQLSKYYLAQN